VGVEVVTFKKRDDKDILDIQATIYCEKESHKGILIGKEGKMLKKIGSLSRAEIEGLLAQRYFWSCGLK